MRKRVIAALLILSCTVMALALPAIAAGAGTTGNLTLQYTPDNGKALTKPTTFYLCRVGTYKLNDDGTAYDFTLDAAFSGADVNSLPDLNSWKGWSDGSAAEKTGTQAGTLVKYIRENKITSESKPTNGEGTAIFNGLEQGLYLVWGNEIKIGRTVYTPQAFLIPLPYPKDNSFIPNVTAKVKADKKTGLTAKKVWEDEDGNEVSPSPGASVTVQLYYNNKKYKEDGIGKQVLNAANNWTYTWEGMDYDDLYSAWTVKEVETPDGYKVTMDWEVDTWTWVITNAKKGTDPDPVPTGTPDPEPTGTPDPEPTGTPDPEPTGTPDPEPTGTPDPEPTGTPDPVPTGTPDPVPTGTPDSVPTGTPDPGPTASPGPSDPPGPSNPPGPGSDYDSITVTKIWESVGSNAPTEITVRLYCTDTGCTESFEAKLNHDNNWSYTWNNLETYPNHNWKVEETVPSGYKGSSEQENNVWTITNTPSGLPPSESPDPDEPPDPSEFPDPGDPGPDWKPGPDEPSLNTEDHFAYLIGYNDGTVRPNANITRAEVVTIFFRLLTDEVRDKYWTTTNPYPDVERTAWYNNAISTMNNMGIIDGYPDGLFRPNAKITRAELTKIAVSFFNYADLHLTGSTKFSDVPRDKWYTRFIEAATELGLIQGYPDNTFRPENAITRAETVTIINRVLGRKPHRDGLLEDMITWPDNMNVNAWYYADIQEATNSHDFLMGWYESNGTWYYPDDLHTQDFQMGWYESRGAWNWPNDMRSYDFLMCWRRSDGMWYYADMRDAGSSHDFVLCRYNSDGTWTWHYADDLREDANAYDFPMTPYDGTWRYPDDEDANAHDFLMCWHRSDGTWTWYYADDLREGTGSRDFQTVLCKTDGMYERWTGLLPVRDWAAFERMWSELHPDVPNPGEVMDKALPSDDVPSVRPDKKREEESED